MSKDSGFDDLFQDFFGETAQNKPNVKQSAKKVNPYENGASQPFSNTSSNENKKPSINSQPQNLKPKSDLQKEKIKTVKVDQVKGGSAISMVPNPELLTPRSIEVDEILSYVPHWMIRWGITVIFLILLGVLGMSYVIKYPDIAEGKIILTSDTPPVEVVTKSSGSIEIFRKDKSMIKERQVFALIKNDAKILDVKKLNKQIKILESQLEKNQSVANFSLPANLELGMIQTAFAELDKTIHNQELQDQSSLNNEKRKTNIRKQLKHLKSIRKEYEERVEILKRGYNRTKAVLEGRYKELYKKGSISRVQYDKKEEELNRKYDEYQQAKSDLSETKKRVIDLNAKFDELDFRKSEDELSGKNAIVIALKNLKNQIKIWENTYLLRAPIKGRLNYLQFVKDDFHLEGDQAVASIAPITKGGKVSQYEGEMLVPSGKSGEIEIGQEVNVKLSAFSEEEYGALVGTVIDMSDVTTTISTPEGAYEFYKIRVAFENGLNTTIGKKIEYRHNMEGTGEVITKEKRLIERVFHELQKALDF